MELRRYLPDKHFENLIEIIPHGKPILCEKPVCKTIEGIVKIANECEKYETDFSMVNNWAYAINAAATQREIIVRFGECNIVYDCYNTGTDGIEWDTIQLKYLSGNLQVNNKSPLMYCCVDEDLMINTRHIEESYIMMISNWINGGKMWGIDDAISATAKVLGKQI